MKFMEFEIIDCHIHPFLSHENNLAWFPGTETPDLFVEEMKRDADLPDSSHDFGKDIIPWLVSRARVMAHPFAESCVVEAPGAKPYWRDVGTIDAYWEANIDLTHVTPELNMYDGVWPIFTYQEQIPPAKFVFDDDDRRGTAVDSLISGGCIVSGSRVKQSLLFSSVRVNSFASLEGCVVLPSCDIGRGAQLKKTVIDHGVVIPEGLVVGEDAIEDARRFTRTENGVCLITQNMIDRLQD
jgi:glucose-1-phosphate adenylyltransferase